MGDAETVQQDGGVAEVAVSDQSTDSTSGDTGEAGGLAEAHGAEGQEQFFDVAGEKLNLKQLQEGYLRTSDYTRKTQELASQRDQLKPYVELADYLKTNQEKAAAIQRYLQGDNTAFTEEPDPIKQELYSLKAQNQQLAQGFARMQTDRQMEELNSDPKYNGVFKDPDLEKLLLKTATYDRVPLRAAADAMFKVITKREVAAGQQKEQEITKNLNSPTRRATASGKPTMNTPSTFNPAKATEQEIFAEARRMMGG
jgi:hypothetical protein